MENLIKVSIIVPIYNSEKFVGEFLDSMLSQSFKLFEIIFVDDGSTDNTAKVIKEYINKDRRIKYVYKENGGAGSARNEGMKYAKGDYLMFLDADDLFSKDLIKELYKAAIKNDADVALCLFERRDLISKQVFRNVGFNLEILKDGECYKGKDVPLLFFRIDNPPWNKIYKRQFIKKHRLQFSTTKVSNDLFFVLASLSVAERLVPIHKELITIRRHINPSSISTNRYEHSEDFVSSYKELYEFLVNNNLDDHYKESYCRAFGNSLMYNSSYGAKPALVERVVKMLNENEPWASLDEKVIKNYLGISLDPKWQKDRINEIKLRNNDFENDAIYIRRSNNLETIALINKLSKECYGRSFE